MRLSIVLEALIEAGATPQMLLAAVKAFEKDIENETAIRRERDRVRKREERSLIKNNVIIQDQRPVCPLDTQESTDTADTKKRVSSLPPLSPLDGFPLPSLIPPYIPPDPSSQKKVYTPSFEKFWQLYPPNGASKTKTYESWQKAIKNGADDERITRAVTEYRTYLDRTDTSVAHATTWLNQSRWEVAYAQLGADSGLNGGNAKGQMGQRGGRAGGKTKSDYLDEQASRVLARFGVSTEAGRPDTGQEQPAGIQPDAQAVLSDNGALREGGKSVRDGP